MTTSTSSSEATLRELGAKSEALAARVAARATAAREDPAQSWEGAHDDEDASYFALKQEMLTAYCSCMSYYMLRKARGESVADHPVLTRLYELRLVFEKLRALEPKLRHQLDKVLSRADDDAATPRPNVASMTAATSGGAGDAEEDGLYRAPRLAAVGYDHARDGGDSGDDSDDSDAPAPAAVRGAPAPRNTRARREEIAHMIRAGGDAPEVAGSSGVGGLGGGTGKKAARRDKRRKEIKEQEQFEEDRMVRVDTNQKAKKKRKVDRFSSSLDDLF